ncbi:spore-associated protein A [Kitasatospora paranensis]|uniref:Spore-associated protein A n=1 Tax=Kitasatospora paranensis TaxID=258053 RepID=A0ABW2FVM0_9ACTN
MLKGIRNLATGVAVLAATGAAVVAAPTAAHAASYNGACGSGYGVVDSMPVAGGTVYLTYDGFSNCVVTVTNTPGVANWTVAEIAISGGGWVPNSGNFTYYAGPVYVYGTAGQCVDWAGYLGTWATRYNSHCG